MFGVPPEHLLYDSYCQQVREIAVKEIRRNLETYFVTLSQFANETIKSGTTVKEKVLIYLEHLQKPGFWGGSESISALSNHFKAVFVIHQQDGEFKFVPSHFEATGAPRYHLFYRGIANSKNHYDSVVCFRPRVLDLVSPHGYQSEEIRTLESDAVVVRFNEPNSALCSVLHQINGSLPSEETLNIIRYLIAGEIERHPNFLQSCGRPYESPEEVARFLFHLRIGREEGGMATLVALSSVLKLRIYVHCPIRDVIRYDPSSCNPLLSVHVLEDLTNASRAYGSILALHQVPDPSSIRCRHLPDPLAVARKLARKEISDSQLTQHLPVLIDAKHGVRFASWNVNGCRTASKQEAIDAALLVQKVVIAVLQEVNLDCQQMCTANYRWVMGHPLVNRKRGLAVLMLLEADIEIIKHTVHGPFLQCLEVSYKV